MSESSDRELLDLIRRRGPLTVVEMAARLGVTGTAIRNRLTRLLGSGLVERKAEHQGRGRPRHTYEASVLAQKRLGQNYADLAVALWDEMMSTVSGPQAAPAPVHPGDRPAGRDVSGAGERPGVGRAARPAHRLAASTGGSRPRWPQDAGGAIPILRQHSCPYYELAEADRTDLRPRAEDVRESAGPGPAAQPVPARRRPLLRLRGEARALRKLDSEVQADANCRRMSNRTTD